VNNAADEFALVVFAKSTRIVNEFHEFFADLLYSSNAFLAIHSALRSETGHRVVRSHLREKQSSCHVQGTVDSYPKFVTEITSHPALVSDRPSQDLLPVERSFCKLQVTLSLRCGQSSAAEPPRDESPNRVDIIDPIMTAD